MKDGNALFAALFQRAISVFGLDSPGGAGGAHGLGRPMGGTGAFQQFENRGPDLVDLLMDRFEQIKGMLAGQQGMDVLLEGGGFLTGGHVIGLAEWNINHINVKRMTTTQQQACHN